MEFMRWGTGHTQRLQAQVLQAEVCWQKIHGILFNSATSQEQTAMLEHFVGECELLGRLHHLCIVQFLGACVLEQGSPLPVLEVEYPVCLSGEVWCPAQEICYGIYITAKKDLLF